MVLDPAAFAALAAAVSPLIYQLINLGRLVEAKNYRGAVFLTGALVLGILFTFLYVGSDSASEALKHLNWQSLVLLGLSVGSSAAVVKDVLKAIDNTQSTRIGPTAGE